ncbi:protein translocase subunit SecD [Nocardioides panacisoli]|uniref:protein translocase subunit SecD n=1 Tax=Nocardioides panacisoli TaxID=627624 RepID=UPI001C638BD3|nr:protein translocase subunit SecD [Nocardioides panacisoli]QYJ05222.1 protein translocase subunit SecD [Nocardioides panacisoli]
MASRKSSPGRTLAIFFIGVAIIFGLVALAGDWKPRLGLDLQGGTRITLTAAGEPSEENLEEARRILDQRVNGSGIVEAEVVTQGDKFIVVEVPGSVDDRAQLEETVSRTAQLRFRLVACTDRGDQSLCQSGQQQSPLGLNRPAPDFDAAADPTGDPSGTPSEAPSDQPSAPDEQPTGGQSGGGGPWDPDAERTVDDELAWMKQPDQRSIELYNRYECNDEGTLVEAQGERQGEPANLEDEPDQPLVACQFDEINGESGSFKYLLSRSVIEGTELDDASAGIPQNDVQWVVNLELGNDESKARPADSQGATQDFEAISRDLVGSERLFAIVLDGKVLSAPTMQAVISNGRSQISGDFTETTANDLANSLKFGALPISFPENQISTDDIGPTLAGDQLQTGLLAGGAGLALVMLFCLFYYRGLGAVVVSSLFIGAGITYAMVLLLSETAGFTLTLPGMAGFIIAVGVVADSFIIYFERIRDEMREGKSMRVAVETGWARARVTRIAANTVQLLSAIVLYVFATGAVKGFGFALGLSTLIDLAVLFWFTKPAMSYLATYRFFNAGTKASGLSKSSLGIDAPATAPAGGKA